MRTRASFVLTALAFAASALSAQTPSVATPPALPTLTPAESTPAASGLFPAACPPAARGAARSSGPAPTTSSGGSRRPRCRPSSRPGRSTPTLSSPASTLRPGPSAARARSSCAAGGASTWARSPACNSARATGSTRIAPWASRRGRSCSSAAAPPTPRPRTPTACPCSRCPSSTPSAGRSSGPTPPSPTTPATSSAAWPAASPWSTPSASGGRTRRRPSTSTTTRSCGSTLLVGLRYLDLDESVRIYADRHPHRPAPVRRLPRQRHPRRGDLHLAGQLPHAEPVLRRHGRRPAPTCNCSSRSASACWGGSAWASPSSGRPSAASRRS